jgi:hypothetical protein
VFGRRSVPPVSLNARLPAVVKVTCRCRPAEPRLVRNIAEGGAGAVRDTYVEFIGRSTPDRFSPETAFI